MNDTRFFERKCFAIMSNALLEFTKEQEDDNSLTLEMKEIDIYGRSANTKRIIK